MMKVKYVLSYNHNRHENAGDESWTKWCETILNLNKDGVIPGTKFYHGTVKRKECYVFHLGFRCSLIEFLKFVSKYKLKVDYVEGGIVFLYGHIHD